MDEKTPATAQFPQKTLFESAYVEAASSDNTRRAYQSDIRDFLTWGGVLPATVEHVVHYLQTRARHTNPRTLIRRVTALRQWHRFQKSPDPTQDDLVKKTLKGITRLHGRPKKQAVALRLTDLDAILSAVPPNDALAIRDRALLLVGFFGAFRRSELIRLQWEDVQFVSDGMIVHVPRSKTDQAGEGSRVIIPFVNEKRCPVRALLAWRHASGFYEGPIFRALGKDRQFAEKTITAHQLNHRIRALGKKAGLPQAEQLSSHSLRRGFATEAARLGASMPAIQRHGRWECTRTVLEYIEAGRQFTDSAVNVLFEY
ncbi:MAG TPA: site-specific integrase [Gammaproteobacteria bacterium]|nr:site-specific integrase [Gammaproteobacteria bacterium]